MIECLGFKEDVYNTSHFRGVSSSKVLCNEITDETLMMRVSVLQDGLTPLHCAARSGHDTAVELLLERGAPMLARTKVAIKMRTRNEDFYHITCYCIIINIHFAN